MGVKLTTLSRMHFRMMMSSIFAVKMTCRHVTEKTVTNADTE